MAGAEPLERVVPESAQPSPLQSLLNMGTNLITATIGGAVSSSPASGIDDRPAVPSPRVASASFIDPEAHREAISDPPGSGSPPQVTNVFEEPRGNDATLDNISGLDFSEP